MWEPVGLNMDLVSKTENWKNEQKVFTGVTKGIFLQII